MEKLLGPHSELLPSAKLFLDDIERIIEILREVSDEIKLITDEYSLSGVDELATIQQEYISKLHIYSSKPYIHVDLNPYQISLYISEDTAALRGTFEKIKSVVYSRRRVLSWLLTRSRNPVYGFLLGLPGSLAAVVSGNILFGSWGKSWLLLILNIGVICCTFTLAGWIYVTLTPRYSVVFLKRRIERESWWRRNRDKIAIEVFTFHRI